MNDVMMLATLKSYEFIVTIFATAIALMYFVARSALQRTKKYFDEEFFLDQGEWEALVQSRHEGDDTGDDFLEEVGIASIYKATSVLELAGLSGPAGEKFAREFSTVPPWVDMSAVRRGVQFQKLWVETYFGTGLASIIESYGYSNGAKILIETGRLACCPDSTRRLLETAFFNLDIIQYGLDHSSPALETIARVRMLHCIVRKHVRSCCPWWKDSMGTPVSQEDGAHTIILNSYAALRGMCNQGLPISPAELDGVSMCWAYVGYLLGMSECYLAKSFQQERRMYHSMLRNFFAPSVDSHTLTTATLRGVAGLPPHHFDLQQQQAIARLSLGDVLADRLALAPTSRLRDRALVAGIRVYTIARWVTYRSSGYAIDAAPYLRKVLTEALRIQGCDDALPRWRFQLSRKTAIKESAEALN